jgi:hypothetical protein
MQQPACTLGRYFFFLVLIRALEGRLGITSRVTQVYLLIRHTKKGTLLLLTLAHATTIILFSLGNLQCFNRRCILICISKNKNSRAVPFAITLAIKMFFFKKKISRAVPFAITSTIKIFLSRAVPFTITLAIKVFFLSRSFLKCACIQVK